VGGARRLGPNVRPRLIGERLIFGEKLVNTTRDVKTIVPKELRWSWEKILTWVLWSPPLIVATFFLIFRFTPAGGTLDNAVPIVAFSISLLVPIFVRANQLVSLMNKQAAQIDQLKQLELREIATNMKLLAPLLDLSFRQLAAQSHNCHLARLVSQQRDDLTHATTHQEIHLRNRKELIAEALFLTHKRQKKRS
jgi:hypothetical protein